MVVQSCAALNVSQLSIVPDFIAETKKSKLELAPEDGEQLAALIAKIYATPKPIVDKIANLIK